MDLTLYKPNDLEKWISREYQAAGIHYPAELEIDRIVSWFRGDVQFYNGPTCVDYDNPFYPVILINAFQKTIERRKAFFHELGHMLLHTGNQDNLPTGLRELQEMQADQFQLYAAMPYYMFEEFKYVPAYNLVKVLMEAFVLPESFVKKRLEHIKNRMYWHEQDLITKERFSQKVVKSTKHELQDFIAETHRRYTERYGKKNENEDPCLL